MAMALARNQPGVILFVPLLHLDVALHVASLHASYRSPQTSRHRFGWASYKICHSDYKRWQSSNVSGQPCGEDNLR